MILYIFLFIIYDVCLNVCFLNVYVIYWFDDSDSKKESFEFFYDGDML